jgi:transitional endoplasmic reticulum ATPase
MLCSFSTFQVVIGVPSPLSRLAILQAHTKNLHLDKDVDLTQLAEITVGYVGADIASLSREAAFAAMKRSFQEEEHTKVASERGNYKGT